LVDFILEHDSTITSDKGEYSVDIDVLWEVVMKGFSGIWPSSRTNVEGTSVGDAWPCDAINGLEEGKETHGLVVFHKLSQWLTYSLMVCSSLLTSQEPLGLIGITFTGTKKMTGLAEYRNGGLFVDYGVLVLKNVEKGVVPRFQVWDHAVVEWRALTVALLDETGKRVRERLGVTEAELPLVKILEAGTWKAGREIAAVKRPETRGPPIEIISDGTVF
jgi:hypothetical protein